MIIVWTYPRSHSTALYRYWMRRSQLQPAPDVAVTEEQVFSACYPGNFRGEFPDRVQHEPYEVLRWRLYEVSKQRAVPVYFKEMAYEPGDCLLEDTAFLADPDVMHTFLIRDPARSIASNYALDPDMSCEEVGIERLYRLFDRIRELTDAIPPVIDGDMLSASPRNVLENYCTAVGLPFVEEALTWKPGTQAALWKWDRWHIEVQNSSGFRSSTHGYEATVDNTPLLADYYRHHRPFYEHMRRHLLTSNNLH
jgi:hypothetical protein